MYSSAGHPPIIFRVWRGEVQPAWAVAVVIIKGRGCVDHVQDGHQGAPVMAVSHTPAVVALGGMRVRGNVTI